MPPSPLLARVFRISAFGLSFGIAGLLAACTTTALNTSVLRPALSPQMAQYRRVVVGPFEGGWQGAGAVRARVEAMLAQAEVDGQRYFTVVEFAQDAELEIALARATDLLVTPETRPDLGRFIGAEAIYFGRVNQFSANRSRYWKEERECIRRENPNKLFSKCLEHKTVKIRCVTVTALVDITVRAADLATKQVHSARLSDSEEARACEDRPYGHADENEVLAEALDGVIEQLRVLVAPYRVREKLRFKLAADGLEGPNKEDFKSAIDWIKAGRTDRGCPLLHALADQTANRDIRYNAGLCFEAEGRLQEAYGVFQALDREAVSPDREVMAALGRVARRLKDRDRLKVQMDGPTS